LIHIELALVRFNRKLMLGKKSGQGVSKLTRLPRFNEIAKKIPYSLYFFLYLKNFDLTRSKAWPNGLVISKKGENLWFFFLLKLKYAS
jgi:hypothetical protein